MGLLFNELWIDLLVITIICGVLFLFKDFNYWKKRNVPHMSPWSFYGNILSIVTLKKSINQYLEILHDEGVRLNSKYIGFWVAEKPSLYICDPELSKKILIRDFTHFSERLVGHKAFSDTFGRSSLFLLKQSNWKNMRTRLTHVFSSGKLKKMETILYENSKNMLKFIKEHNNFTGEQPLNARDLVGRYGADNLVQAFLGLDGQCLHDLPGKRKVEYDAKIPKYNDIGNANSDVSIHRALEFSSFFIIPEIASFFRFKFFSANSSKFFRDIFWSAVNLRRQNTPKSDADKEQKNFKDLLDMLMHFDDEKLVVDGMKYTGDVLPAQFAVIFVAGFDTSSSTMSLFLATMTQYPDIQDRVREEVGKIISKHGDLNFDVMAEMKYLDMAFKEILRLYPTLPFLDRMCTKTYKIEDNGTIIEKGTKVFLSLTGIHTDPRYWKDPFKYDPERFSAENKAKITPYSYIPFGEGPKICIGERFGILQTKLGIASILSKYRVRSDGSLKTCKDLGPNDSYKTLRIPMATRGVVLFPAKPLTMYFDYMPVDEQLN